MPLTFVDKKKHWPPPKPVQYALAVLALLAAVAVLVGWLYIRFIYTEPVDTPDDHTQTETELPNTAYCLVMIEDVGYERFALITADPKGGFVSVAALSPTMSVGNNTLASVLQKYGAARTVQTVAETLDVPVTHFLSFSIADVQNLFTKLGENLQCTLSEEISYRDENGAIVRLTTDKRALTPKQIVAVLQHTEWKTADNGVNIAADLTAALINQCLQPKRSLKGYFSLLSNSAHTNLRIDHFNAYLSGLEHLSSVNDGALAKRIDVNP